MKKLIFLTALFFIAFCTIRTINGQVIVLKFTAQYNAAHVDIDSVRITNLTHPGDTVLLWPDTTLVLGYVGTREVSGFEYSGFDIRLGSANPVADQAVIQLSLPASGNIQMRVSDISGWIIKELNRELPAGRHKFIYSPSYQGISFITTSFESEVKALKVTYTGNNKGSNMLYYIGTEGTNIFPKSVRSALNFVYSSGDSLRFRGWYNGSNSLLYASPLTNSTFTFHFGMNYPCPGLVQFTYGGQTYNTIQIGDQCWMKENLNIGTMASSTSTSTSHSNCSNNGLIEKYCYNNDTTNCAIYGGLYDWDEMMQYSSLSGIQGICPNGWHLPTDAEWCALTTFLDSTVNCNILGSSGTDAGGKLKETGTIHWASPNTGGTNESGFTGLGAGDRHDLGGFWNLSQGAFYWSSSESSSLEAIDRHIAWTSALVNRMPALKTAGFSVRCLLKE
jgi:uncharacterized protein (TIGR02145 family)